MVVTKSTNIVTVGKDGTFSAADLEAGDYTLKVFHEGSWIYEQSFQVAAGRGRDVKLEIELKPGKSDDNKAKADSKSDKAEKGAKQAP